jgi:hypothetical protein
MISYRSKLKSFGNKTCTSAGFSTTKSTGTDLGLTAGLHIMNLAVDCPCNEEPVCFVCERKENIYSIFLDVVNRNLLNCTIYSARKLTHVKFELL